MRPRSDGRAADELRPVRVTRRYLKHAMGSCIFELGDTRVLCAATSTRASRRGGAGRGLGLGHRRVLDAARVHAHALAAREPSSGPKGRTHEIQRLIGRSLRTVVDLGGLGRRGHGHRRLRRHPGRRRHAHRRHHRAPGSRCTTRSSTWQEAGKIAEIPLLGKSRRRAWAWSTASCCSTSTTPRTRSPRST